MSVTVTDSNTHSPRAGRDASPPPGWPEHLTVRAWLVRDADRWIALAQDFDVAGQGLNEHEAVQDMGELLEDYLNSCLHEGIGFADARRPIPLRDQLRLRALHLMAPLQHLHAQLRAASRRTFDVDVHGGRVGLHIG